MTENKQPLKMIVYSDYICPFCFIGDSRLERLRKEFPSIEVEWRSYEIHPEVPEKGAPPAAVLDEQYYRMVWRNVKLLANEAGLEINAPPKISNSRLAIQAAEFAKSKGKFDAFHESLFKAYFQEGQNIGDIEILRKLAEKSAMDPDEIQEALEKGEFAHHIDENEKSASNLGISGVPAFSVGDRVVVGAQPYETLKEAVELANPNSQKGKL